MKELLLSFLFPSPKPMCERRESVYWPDKARMLSHFSRSHEHFVIICLVLHFPTRGVEVGKVGLQDVSPKVGQISTPMSTTKNIKHRESTVGYEKGGHFDCECTYFVANLFNAMFFARCPKNGPELSTTTTTTTNNNNHHHCFIPDISLLNLQRFVVEVKWLFPVIPQKNRESTNQRNTEPS